MASPQNKVLTYENKSFCPVVSEKKMLTKKDDVDGSNWRQQFTWCFRVRLLVYWTVLTN
jgi:hypothetical protein